MSFHLRHNAERLLIIAFLICSLLTACMIFIVGASSRSQIPVAYGYLLLCYDSTSVVLADPRGSVVVSEQIQEIGVANGKIIGQTVHPGAYAHPGWSFPVGYFVVDSRTRKVTAGLTREELATLIGQPPVLHSVFSWSLWN
jgi:hypothetical protein